MEQWTYTIFPFLWIVLRMSGLLMTAPVLGTKYIPWPVKAALSLTTAYYFWAYVPVAPLAGTLTGMVYQAGGEVFFGLALGFMGTIIMGAIELAGHVADVEMGFGIANVIDPQYGTSSPLLGTIKYMLVTLCFLAINGHHMFIVAVNDSFSLVPAGAGIIVSAWTQLGLQAFSKMLWMALLLSCPIWASMLIVDITLGIVTQTVPQLNVFVVGMPVKALVGLAILSVSLGYIGIFTAEITEAVQGLLHGMLGVLTP